MNEPSSPLVPDFGGTGTRSAAPSVHDRVFVTTRWTCVLAARGESPEAQKALSELCEAYWTPVFRFLRREGKTEDLARELTQEFFGRILSRDGFAHADPERGRFRSFLLGAVRHFLADVRDRECASKRGGGVAAEVLSVQESHETESESGAGAGIQVADLRADVPDTFFDRQWAFALMARAFARLSEEQQTAGKSDQYAILKPWLVGETASLPQAEAARKLGLTEGAVKVAIHRLRKRFRELIRAEIAQTVPDPADTDAELRYLIEVLAAD
jgi:RNA polymerase sigma-70 factor (ECF subfamily)